MQGAIERRTVEETAHLGEEVRVAVVIATKGRPAAIPKVLAFRTRQTVLPSLVRWQNTAWTYQSARQRLSTHAARSGRPTYIAVGGACRPHARQPPATGIRQLHERKGYQKTLIAIANKHARMLWAMLPKAERYEPDAWQRHSMHQPLPAAAA